MAISDSLESRTDLRRFAKSLKPVLLAKPVQTRLSGRRAAVISAPLLKFGRSDRWRRIRVCNHRWRDDHDGDIQGIITSLGVPESVDERSVNARAKTPAIAGHCSSHSNSAKWESIGRHRPTQDAAR